MRKLCYETAAPKRIQPKDVEFLKTLLRLVAESENLQELDRFEVAEVALDANVDRYDVSVIVGPVVLTGAALSRKVSLIRPSKRTLVPSSTDAVLVDDISIHRRSIR